MNPETEALRAEAVDGEPSERQRRAIGVLTFMVVIVVNGMAGSGALSGDSIGVIASRYPTAFLPASYVFGIWSVIYLGLLAFTVDMAIRRQSDAALHRRLRRLWPLNGLLNAAWLTAFSFSRFGVAMVLMVCLLINLSMIQATMGDPGKLGMRDRLTTATPFNLYLAWISVAVIANAFQFAASLGWSNTGSTSELWSVAMMTAATGVGAFMAFRRGVLVFPLVVAWALAGIAVRHSDSEILTIPAWSLALVGLLSFLTALVRSGVQPAGSEPGPSGAFR